MKLLPALLVSSLLLLSVHGQIPSTATLNNSGQPTVVGPMTVTVPTTAAELARGYADAIPQMSLKSLVIFMKSDGKVVPIKGIRSAKAMGAVLLIVFSAGDTMAINAEHIIMMTDGSRTP